MKEKIYYVYFQCLNFSWSSHIAMEDKFPLKNHGMLAMQIVPNRKFLGCIFWEAYSPFH